jgi:hypothetical protein
VGDNVRTTKKQKKRGSRRKYLVQSSWLVVVLLAAMEQTRLRQNWCVMGQSMALQQQLAVEWEELVSILDQQRQLELVLLE